MSDYTDKEKRKGRPSRRRVFFMIITLILLCLAGGIVLTPQIDAWLATDPFTPQCHFEEDRLFATGNPPQIMHINQGQFEKIDNGESSEIVWSPNGEQVIFTFKSREYHLYTGESLDQVYDKIPVSFLSWKWSPDNKYLARINDNGEFVVVDLSINEILEELVMQDIIFRPLWSPNSKYILVYTAKKFFLLDIENKQKNDFIPFNQITNSPVWSNSSKTIYYFQNTDLIAYNVASTTTIKLLTSINGVSAEIYVSPDDKYVAIRGYNNSLILNTQTGKTQEIGTFHGWLSDGKFVSISTNGGIPFYKHVEIYDPNTHQSEIIFTYSRDMERIFISPSTRYVLIATQILDYSMYQPISYYDLTLYDTHLKQHVTNIQFKNEGHVEWISQDGLDWLVIREKLKKDETSPYLTYLYNPADNEKCKLGWSTYSLEFQPQPAGDSIP